MSKGYDLSKKSDMRKFSRALEEGVMDAARDAISEDGVAISCPHCGKEITVFPGENTCKHCGNIVNVDLKL